MRYALFFLAQLSAFAVHAVELKLELNGKVMAGNQMRVAVYSAKALEQFPADDKFFKGAVKGATDDMPHNLLISDLPSGKYAIAAYVDNNKNGKQDKNFLSVPKEIYGFSNNARSRFGSPNFAAAEFEFGENAVSKSIYLH